MKIDKQETSGSIFNIGGNFVNQGILNAENVYLNNDGTVQELVRPNQETLRIQFGINYVDDLANEQSGKRLIEREDLNQVCQILTENKEIGIVGNPGVGKTCMLFHLSCKMKDVIYINLKNKSLQTVLLHIINKYNIIAGVQLIDKIDIENGLELFQGLLVDSKITFLIDECENSSEIIKRLLPLKKHQNIFVYASQLRTDFDAESIEVVPIGNFNESEAKRFLQEYDISLDVLDINELLEASQGNALYLYYYSQYSISPFPKGVDQYHRAIWKQLDVSQKECVIVSSLAHFPVTTVEVSQLLFSGELQKTIELIDTLRLVNRLTEGKIEVFHPAFRKFVVEQTKTDGLLDVYKSRLGNYFKDARNFRQAIYLLIDLEPETLEDFGFEILPEIYNSGEFEFSNKIAYALLKKPRDPATEGYLKFCIYQNQRFLQLDKDAALMIEDAIQLFARAGNRRLHLVAQMNKAMDLVESGGIAHGRELVDSILEQDDEADPEQTGPLLVSLSKIYIDLHQYKQAADVCKKAYDLFAKQKNLYGMVSSMANLASSLNHFDGYRDLSRKYAHKLLDLGLTDYYFGLELIALNALTSIYRQMNKYEEAKKYGALAVRQCQKYKLFKKAILNLINYGNIFRDTGETDEALKIYQEALFHAVEMNIHKEQCRIHWIMSEIFVEKNDLEEGLRLIDLSIGSAKLVNYSYGIAHGLKERGSILEARGEFKTAAINYEEAFNIFVQIGGMIKESNRCLTLAILLYMKTGEKNRLERLVKISVASFGGENFIDLMGIADYEENIVDIHDYFSQLNVKYIENPAPNNQVPEYLDYLRYCKDNLESSKLPFKKIVLALCANHCNNPNRLSLLSILIEQSGKLLEAGELQDLISEIQNSIKSLKIRKTVGEIVFLSIDPKGFNLEINVHQEDPMGIKLCLAFLIFRTAIPEIFSIEGLDIKQKYFKIYFHEYDLLNEVMSAKGGLSLDFNDDLQSHVIKWQQAEFPTAVVINNDYEAKADLLRFPGNKCFIYLLRTLGCEVSGYFYNKDIGEIYEITRSITARIALIFGYTNVDDDAERKFDYNLDLSKIEELIAE
ncbi:tetratricopeptide repeat protein [Pedobacter frigiditerrae]|uniref:Tetratricopeptide repeat protein n=1 Tax=Pedobacter frigiditerrae TaxID=2530452 RepID=A0A4R0MPA3_9SPHI|nr:tetratricopeptide repeat protein [Pedobacter frigiditerrae]TCC88658.1 tetratricopeptide repeat protein [Pedobacter frigiditerrae]